MLVLLLLCFGASSSLEDITKSGGQPKFPYQNCGTRHVDWTPRNPKVIGGEKPPLGAVPWIVDLLHKNKHHCGGVLISSRLVLTVAHCYKESLIARVGSYSTNSTLYEQTLEVVKVVLHPDFRKFGHYSNDIAILLLPRPGFQKNIYVKPACVPRQSPPSGSRCEVSGWGAYDPQEEKEISPELQTASVPLLSLEVCRGDDILGGRRQKILDTMVCAGKLKGGVDACGGDSGGPLMCHYDGRLVLTGLVSWGDGCAKKHRPGVYTRVASYKDWITTTAQALGIKTV